MSKTKTIDTTPSLKSPKNWLQRLKDESWEAELLVSTISIFGTLQMFGLIDWATNKFIYLLDPSQYLIGYMIVFFWAFSNKYSNFNVRYPFFFTSLLGWSCWFKFGVSGLQR